MGFFDRLLDGGMSSHSTYDISLPDKDGIVRYRMTFHGRVQGVGFRYTMRMHAMELGLSGWVHNNYDGSVAAEIQGETKKIRLLVYQMQESSYIRIDHIEIEELSTDTREEGFGVK